MDVRSLERLGLVEALSRSDSRALARALGDTPYTVIAVHLLGRRLCRAYVSGSVADFHAALIQAMDDPTSRSPSARIRMRCGRFWLVWMGGRVSACPST